MFRVSVRNDNARNKANKASLWKTVRHCLNPYGNSSLSYSRDCAEVVNDFNEYFTSVGDKAARQAEQLAVDFDLPPLGPDPLLNTDSEDKMPKFNFRCVSTEEIKAINSRMPSSKSPGHDKIHMRVIKTCLPRILQVITDLVNTSLMTGRFPRDWKLAEVVAHLKEGDHEVAKNNRPISLLPVLSKVLEYAAHEQFSHFIASNNMLSVHQSGNKRLHSTETLGILFTDHLQARTQERGALGARAPPPPPPHLGIKFRSEMSKRGEKVPPRYVGKKECTRSAQIR